MLNRNTLFISTLSGIIALAATTAHADPILVPKGMEVPLVFDQPVSSKSAKVGDTVAMHVAQDVSVDGQLIIHQGAHVTGIITGVSHRNVFGINGRLRLTFEPVRSTRGKFIDLEPEHKGKLSGSRPDHAAEISGGAALVLGPIGLVGGIFVEGKNVNVHPGDRMLSDVSRDMHLR